MTPAGEPSLEPSPLLLDLPDEAATAGLAARLAALVRRGDVIALKGTLGAGKTSFARAFINALPGPEEEVVSPTFTLLQLYERGPLTVYHFDLYRISGPEEAEALGLEEAFAQGVTLIEWPERLGPLLPEARLELELRFPRTERGTEAESGAREAWLRAGAGWGARLERLAA